jgi:inner membrane protein
MTADLWSAGLALISSLSRPVRWIAIAFLALVLLVPLAMVESVVRERHRTYQAVIADIAGSWSGEQVLAGPLLVVPYTERIERLDEVVTPEGEKRTVQRWESCRRQAVLLPDALDVAATLVPEVRRRGIYRVQVYTAEVVVAGAFRDPRAAVAALTSADRLEGVDWSKAVIGFGLSDPRGIVEAAGGAVDGITVQARPGTTLAEIAPHGFHAPVGETASDGLELSLPLVIRGSGSLRFLPLGETTRATLGSTWPHPSFIGDVLPVERAVGDGGFSAEWAIPLLNRSFPQAFTAGAAVAIDEISSGVRLFEPVALYDLVTRAVKYGLLFVALTFLTLGLIELVTGLRLSLVQFLLIGFALALFFLILVALAEHLGFATAYVLASATVVALNTLYCAAILQRRGTAALVGVVLAALYGVLYTILKAEDFALLGGTLLLLVALSVTMVLTRRIHEPQAGV